MFDISFTELLLVVVLAFLFIGPKDFPVVVRTIARAFFHVKRFWADIKDAMADIAKETGVDDIKRELEDEYIRDMKMIEGDDGKMYEAFDMDELENDKLMTPLDKQKAEDMAAEQIPHESPYKFPNKGGSNE